ncbi:MAG: hypothetical protein IJ493_10500 [Clostridia bacterium]|nr:hypothetical protein [Clostridia bacterium]
MSGTLSCGDTQTPADTTAAGTSDSTTTPADSGYDYPDVNYDGYEFRILNATVDASYGCYVSLDFEEQTGEPLDDAVYQRNIRVEDKLGIEIIDMQTDVGTVWGTLQTALIDQLIQSVMAGDDAYDAAYLAVGFKPSVITDGYLTDLYDIPTLNLDAEWWDSVINDSLTINGFTFNAEGNAVYGVAAHTSSTGSFIYSSGIRYTSEEKDGSLKLTIGSEKLYNMLDKLGTIMSVSDGHAHFDQSQAANPSYYYNVFAADHALFLTSELKGALSLRDMSSTFGLVPLPKYDENQESYYSLTNYSASLLCVPKSADNLERTGVILDALTYESYDSVLPVYYDITVSQKGLRNDESIEMLSIIQRSRGTEFTRVYGINTNIHNGFIDLISKGSESAATIIASNESAAQQKLNDLTSFFAE